MNCIRFVYEPTSKWKRADGKKHLLKIPQIYTPCIPLPRGSCYGVDFPPSYKQSCQELSTLTDECDDCRDIGVVLRVAAGLINNPGYFSLAFPRSRDDYGYRLANIGQRFLGPDDDIPCQLCLMLTKSCNNLQGDWIEEGCELRALPFSVASGRVRDRSVIEDNPVALFIGRREHFERDVIHKILAARNGVAVLSKPGEDPNLFSLQLVPEYYNHKIIRPWIWHCQEHHKLCRPNSSTVNGLHLIDCESRKVKPAAENDRYVALSYIWGKCATQQSDDFTTLPVSLPSVINDAISVTMALGYHYLWVDKYCIDRNNDYIKHDQIRQMHIIYEKAELTIIAACGLDQNDGLTGVSTPRLGMMIKLGNASLSWVANPQQSIRGSRWSTRGWTFQEGVLARRRLFFTKEQIYFECNVMNCYENLHIPLNTLQYEIKAEMMDFYRPGMFGGRINTQNPSIYQLYLQYCTCVGDYSRRELTYDADVLNAFLGIIQRFESKKTKERSGELQGDQVVIQGILYFPKKERLSFFYHSLCWYHPESVRAKRRPQFPSWTWLGWSGVVRFPAAVVLPGGDINFYPSCKDLTFQSQSGVKWRTPPREDWSQPSSSTYPILYLEAYEVRERHITYRRRTRPQRHAETGVSWIVLGHDAQLYISEKSISNLQLLEEIKYGSTWRCIYVGHNGWKRNESWVMLLKRTSSDTWSRAGLFQVDCTDNNVIFWLQEYGEDTMMVFKIN